MKRQKPIKNNPCKYCGSNLHTSLMCFEKPRKPIRQQGKVALRMASVRKTWFALNPPDKDGFYYCYLQISKFCPKRMTKQETTLDHVEARSREPGKRYELGNLLPACFWCNKRKGSRSVEEALKLRDQQHLTNYELNKSSK